MATIVFTPEQLKYADEMHRDGWAWEHVADMMDVGHNTLRKAMRAAGYDMGSHTAWASRPAQERRIVTTEERLASSPRNLTGTAAHDKLRAFWAGTKRHEEAPDIVTNLRRTQRERAVSLQNG